MGRPEVQRPGDGGRPQNALTGQLFVVNSGSSDITVPSTYKSMRLWRNTAVANLSAGQSRTLAPGGQTLGYEWDIDADNGFRPRGRSSSRRPPSAASSRSPTTARSQTGPRHRRTTSRCTGPRAARSSSVRAPCNGRGASTPPTRGTTAARAGLTRPGHAAGDGQPLRRHGRAGHDAAKRPRRGHAVDRHDRAELRHHQPGAGRRRSPTAPGHNLRDRNRYGRHGRRRRGLDRRRHQLAPGDGYDRRGPTAGSSTAPRARRSCRERSTTAATSSPRRRASASTSHARA